MDDPCDEMLHQDYMQEVKNPAVYDGGLGHLVVYGVAFWAVVLGVVRWW